MKVTYQGVAGAYSHIAAKEIFPEAEYIACETFEQAAKLVENGDADYAVLPIQNSNAGRVDNMYKLLPDIKLKAVEEHFLRIRHQLIGLPSASLEEINGALSHPQALMQCSSFLRKHNIEPMIYMDTAKSCEEILKLNDKSKAGIASVLAAEIYNLKILSPNIENAENNTTRFIVWKKDNQARDIDNCEIISLCLFKCKTQDLPTILSIIKENEINLQHIESYTKNSFSSCYFYIEINSVSSEQKHIEVMNKIEKHTTEFTHFGTFESKKHITKDKKMSQQFIIYDTEYASWKGFIDLPIDDEKRKKAEIVQIAALKINLDDLSIADEFNCYIKPHFEPNLTEYFTNLTGLTDELLDREGTDFMTAYGRFLHFAQKLPCYSHAWGQKQADELVIRNNLEMWQMENLPEPDFRNIAWWFDEKYKQLNMNITKQSSGQIGKILGLDKEIAHLNLDEHNALYDVYSILLGLRKLGFTQLF